MKAGRSGVISVSLKRRQDQYAHAPLEEENNLDIEQQIMTRPLLTLYNFPVIIWSVGVLITLGGFTLVCQLIWKFGGYRLKNFNQGYWWQYFISCVIILIGVCFILAYNMEKADFNRQLDYIHMVSKNIFCQKKLFKKKLTQLFNVSIVKRGQDTTWNKTLHYKLLLNFDDGSFLELMETHSLKRIKIKVPSSDEYEQYIKLKCFLGQQKDLKQINVIDESTLPH